MSQIAGSSSGGETLYYLAKDEAWQEDQDRKCKRAKRRLKYSKCASALAAIGISALLVAREHDYLPELRDVQTLGLGGLIVVLIIGLIAIYRYSHVHTWTCTCPTDD